MINTYKAKLKHLLPTFFLISVCTITILLLLRWTLSIEHEVLVLKEEVWEMWLPLTLPWIPILIWFRPKTRILSFKGDNDNGRFFIQLVATVTIMASLIVAQKYLSTATGKLTNVTSVSEIETLPKERFYTISDFKVVPELGSSYTDFRSSGRHNDRFNFDVFFVCPIIHDSLDIIKNLPKVWYGINYREVISNRLSTEEKEQKYNAFYKACIDKLNALNFYDVTYFERIPYSDDLVFFQKAIKNRVPNKADFDFTVLVPKHQPFQERNGNKFIWIFGSYGIGLAILLFSLLWTGFNTTEYERQLTGKKTTNDELLDILKLAIPRGEHFTTSIIADANILVFLIMIFSGVHILYPTGVDLLEWGGVRRSEVLQGEWWRLFTAMFVHAGVMHLMLNIVGLGLISIFIEPVLGRIRMMILYLMAGIFASIASIWWHSNMISVGASGAIFGLFGAALGLLFTKAVPTEEKGAILFFVGLYVVISLVMGLVGNIDNASHIGGLISGFALVFLLLPFGKTMYKR
ncbi:MAG: rhomboid family intramembrane serine protease [Hymenobacteraceae bacterium]|nr:rhomboid family intramembrane serine protease [Hymenobacteraceae bacterium]MDX5396785.1 rhomboid family intramembrane serine protease [Hymenobacteraceae bacterium]MDX5443732.1 rhomboid family intramembrane serine protease [Hymenobacteraceae bacterium]MDX5512848.1 rhomboid family intramembrane serine protease [Hymenobacteraceae bacterium]